MLKIRTYLALVSAAILLPVAVFSAIALDMLRDGERDAALQALTESARATQQIVDRELAGIVGALEVLATSPHLENGNLEAFYQQAMLLKREESWTVLLDENAQQLINTAVRFGEVLPAGANPNLLRQVLATQKPLASDLFVGPINNKLVTTLYVPVPAHGGKRYALLQTFTTEFFAPMVSRRSALLGWMVVILDRQGRFIARSQRPRETVGQTARPELVQAALTSTTGLIRHPSLEGNEIYGAFTHSEVSGWTVGVAAPVESIEATAGRAVRVASGGLLLAVLFALAAATFAARRLARGVTRATRAATTLASGAVPRLVSCKVLEFDQLHTALVDASVVLASEKESRIKAEAERERLLLDESRGRLRAEADNIGKDQFLAMLAHELRNPLAAINGAIALGERVGYGTPQSAEACEVIHRQTLHMTHLVDDLLDVSRMVSGNIKLDMQPLDLGKMARDCLASMRVTGRTAAHAVRMATEPLWVMGDPTRLEQIVNNLLVNAFKFTPPNGSVELVVCGTANEAVLTVKDSGMGISPELMPHIFEVFIQGAPSPDRVQGGLGIGLALVKQLVSLHGGTVSAESSGPGQGSTFTVRLPRMEAPEDLPAMEPAGRSHDHGWRILLVEDNDDARRMMSRLLVMEGHEVLEASTGTEGLHTASQQRPDLAIVDIGLPEMTGYEVARRLRADTATATMGLIAITGYGQEQDRKNALAASFDYHLVKPIDVDRLLEVIDLCGEAALQRQSPQLSP